MFLPADPSHGELTVCSSVAQAYGIICGTFWGEWIEALPASLSPLHCRAEVGQIVTSLDFEGHIVSAVISSLLLA